jgi:hypothetical protein
MESKILPEEIEWVKQLLNQSSARTLVDHLSAFETINQFNYATKGTDCPFEQASTWRRIFCYDLQRNDTPLGIPYKCDFQLPKCIAILNLSGKHCIYYTESYVLCKLVCLSCQNVSFEQIAAIKSVFKEAESLNASVLLCFCLPFQAGINKSYWDIRTIRKTVDGSVKDGECCFSSEFDEPRSVPSTTEIEILSDNIMDQLTTKFKKMATPICLDNNIQKDDNKKMTPQEMENMLNVIKADRKKIIHDNKLNIENITKKHNVDLTNANSSMKQLEETSKIKLSRIVELNDKLTKDLQHKLSCVEENNSSLKEQVDSQNKLILESKATFNGYKLEKEQEICNLVKRLQYSKTHTEKLKQEIANCMNDNARILKKQKEDHENTTKLIQSRINTLQSNLNSTNSASLVVQASAKQAHMDVNRLKDELNMTKSSLDALKKKERVTRGILLLAKCRFELTTKDTSQHQQINIDALQLRFKQSELEKTAQLKSMRLEIDNADKILNCSRLGDTKQANDKNELHEAKRELGRKDHLIKEIQKRNRFLENKLAELTTEVKIPQNTQNQCIATHKQTTVIPIPSYQQFSEHQLVVDPCLENTISNLYMSLNWIVATARVSRTASKDAELMRAKLDALYSIHLNQKPNM